MGAQSSPILTKTRTAGDVINKRRFVDFTDKQAAEVGVEVLGVARAEAQLGEDLPVDMLGTAVIETGGVFNVGFVMSDGQGRAIEFVEAGDNKPAGIALEASGKAGQFVEMLILH